MVTKAEIVASLEESRRRTLGLLAPVPDHEQRGQVSELMSPLCWDLAHIGHYEELWLLRELVGADPTDAAFDDVYDAFKHPRRDRPALDILDAGGARAFDAAVRTRVLEVLDTLDLDGHQPLLADGFVYGMVVQHEHQHDETLLATLQLMDGFAHPAADGDAGHPCPDLEVARVDLPADVLVVAGEHVLGTDTAPWAYDNERPAHVVELDAYRIDTTAVTNAAYTRVRRSRGLRRSRALDRGGVGVAHRSRARGTAVLDPRHRRRVGPSAVRTHRTGPGRRAGAARLLVRSRRVRRGGPGHGSPPRRSGRRPRTARPWPAPISGATGRAGSRRRRSAPPPTS